MGADGPPSSRGTVCERCVTAGYPLVCSVLLIRREHLWLWAYRLVRLAAASRRYSSDSASVMVMSQR
jgi:hypothetical protein